MMLTSGLELPKKLDIEQAHLRIAPYIHRTAVLNNRYINERTAADVVFKCENFQKVGAFKYRGASNAVLKLLENGGSTGAVATHSSGNHAQALALAARTHGLKAYIVMPRTAPAVKQAAVREYGAEVVLCEPTLEAREQTLLQVVQQTDAVFIHPYNNWDIIEAQATAAKELLHDFPNLQCLLAPVGGGGLLSGTLLAAHYFAPQCAVYGAEPDGANDAWKSFQQKTWYPSLAPNTIADGLLTSLGDKTFPIVCDFARDILCVSEAQIVEAMQIVWERMKIIIEPSSAVPLAAVLNNAEIFAGKRIGIIFSGGNVDLKKLPFV